MPGTVRFLANATDPTDPLTTFGAGHVTDFDAEDDEWVKVLWLEGKAEIISTTDPASVFAPKQVEQPPIVDYPRDQPG